MSRPIPGGYSPDHLRIDRRFVQFVERFDATRQPVAAVCHGPQRITSRKPDDLEQFSAAIVEALRR